MCFARIQAVGERVTVFPRVITVTRRRRWSSSWQTSLSLRRPGRLLEEIGLEDRLHERLPSRCGSFGTHTDWRRCDERTKRTRDRVRVREGALVDLEARDAEAVCGVANRRAASVASAREWHETERDGLEE